MDSSTNFSFEPADLYSQTPIRPINLFIQMPMLRDVQESDSPGMGSQNVDSQITDALHGRHCH